MFLLFYPVGYTNRCNNVNDTRYYHYREIENMQTFWRDQTMQLKIQRDHGSLLQKNI